MYRAGFARAQEPYNLAVGEVFAGLDKVEEILSHQRYLTGPTITEADIRLYTTLVRFDCVYVGHFKVARQCFINYVLYSGITYPIKLPKENPNVSFM